MKTINVVDQLSVEATEAIMHRTIIPGFKNLSFWSVWTGNEFSIVRKLLFFLSGKS